MDVILTHDNSDFDALASQLAAHKLTPEATPVLSQRLNRNLRHFLALYWDELPFVKPDDLPRQPIERAIIVDTQNVPSIRGMGKKTAIRIIDHHAEREATPEGWQVIIDTIGATTTLLVEQIKELTIALTPIEATLLALGIYEDTGSLSYGTTTPRDIYAAAWLLEHGAMLDVVRSFLYHPLTEEQRRLYEHLLEKVENYDVEGLPVVIAGMSIPEPVEEIATLAHQMRDLLDPAALFLLVEMPSHIQLIARSTVDAVDVGAIARHFDGGGHTRAAAAIIRGQSLDWAKKAMLKYLRKAIRPSLTVADLMSHGVQTLPPDARARDADSQMRRYGYEGFPVVRDGKIAGLLTRRAVDRAIDHGLDGVRVEQLMEAGEVSVLPSDSIPALQQVMMASGWGQIPVVDGERKVIGVVTRTDLIKHLGHAAPPADRRAEIDQELEQALPPILMALTRVAGRQAHDAGLSLYVVGGFVRDLLLGYPLADLDFVVEGDAIRLTRILQQTFGGETRSHGRFGTGKWLLDEATWGAIAAQLDVPLTNGDHLPAHIDFVTARTEYYRAPTELPEVERGSIKHDLHRRDFTINTLAIRLDPSAFGQILDFYGGEADLDEQRIRVLHSLSFVDDPTRILRAARLEQRLGFRIEARTEELIRHALPLLDKVSGDRIRHEIELILAEEKPEQALTRLGDLGVLAAIHPALKCGSRVKSAFDALRGAIGKPVWPELKGFDLEWPYFAVLTYDLAWEDVQAICERLKVQHRTLQALEHLHGIKPHMEELAGALPPSRIDAILSPADDRVLLAIWAAASETAREAIDDYANRLRHITTTVDGTMLKDRGLKPGPRFGVILRRLRAARLDEEIETPEQEEAMLAHLIAEMEIGDERSGR
ncbi:MAG: CBS domain-containing protein [Anaerolineae bacterium]|nr:CBS domain-containing protein [Anaerolineae bacterium]